MQTPLAAGREPLGLDPDRIGLLRPGRWSIPEPYLAAIEPFAPAVTAEPLTETLTGTLPGTGSPAPAVPDVPASPAAAVDARPVARIPLMDLATEPAPTDRNALRDLLGGQYDVHARTVTRILSEQPGLRVAGRYQQQDMAAALVALRAYCAGGRDRVNATLRRAADPVTATEVHVLAWWATLALRNLPTVLGPVFRLGFSDPAPLAVYRAGVPLVEPAFVDAGAVRPVAPDGATVEYVIWARSARRLDPLRLAAPRGGHRSGLALFAPATRFRVLAVEKIDREPTRVYLREVASGRTGEDARAADERELDRLRRALPVAGTAADGDADPADRPDWTIGVDDDGRRFTIDEADATVNATVDAAADWGR